MGPQCRSWTKSSFSNNTANCVEVRFVVGNDGGTEAQVRNSRVAGGPVLVFDQAEWQAFELGMFNHEFEMPC